MTAAGLAGGGDTSVRVLPYGPAAVLVEVPSTAVAAGLYAWLRRRQLDGVRTLVPAARTVLVEVDPARLAAVTATIAAAELSAMTKAGVPPALVEVPTVYDGTDLHAVAAACAMSVEEVVARHSAATYTAAFCGFAPGFAYLAGGDPVLRPPRRAEPRVRVPAGAVAIAGEYSAVYPTASPGGWQLLGRTDLTVWDARRDPPALLSPGTEVRFVVVGGA